MVESIGIGELVTANVTHPTMANNPPILSYIFLALVILSYIFLALALLIGLVWIYSEIVKRKNLKKNEEAVSHGAQV